MENKMGHFEGWKFGVPVKVIAKSHADQQAVSGEVRLIAEGSVDFVIICELGGVVICDKPHYSYELISYKADIMSPRYPVCQTKEGHSAYCNQSGQMSYLDIWHLPLERYSVATLTIDGKTIELSAETVNNLRKELGI